MGLICSIAGHAPVTVRTWGKNAGYEHQRCRRCGKETYLCHYEQRTLNADEQGIKVLKQMMSNKQFSRQCHIHAQFRVVEEKYPFNFYKKATEFDRLKQEYGLMVQPACPIYLFVTGRWPLLNPMEGKRKNGVAKTAKTSQAKTRPNAESRKKKGKTLSQKPGKEPGIVYIPGKDKKTPDTGKTKQPGESFQYTVDLNKSSVKHGSSKSRSKSKEDPNNAKRIAEYTRKMFYHEKLEQYERAAVYRDKIKALKSK